MGRTPDMQSRQLAGALAAEMYGAGGRRIDAVVMSTDATRTFAVQGRLDDPAHLRVNVPTMTATQTPLDESTQRVDQQVAQQALAREQVQTVECQQHGPRSIAIGSWARGADTASMSRVRKQRARRNPVAPAPG